MFPFHWFSLSITTVTQLWKFVTEHSFHFWTIYIYIYIFFVSCLPACGLHGDEKAALSRSPRLLLPLFNVTPPPFSFFLSLSLLQVCLTSHLPACFPPSPLPLSRRWRPAPCPATTCPRTSWWWWGMAAWGRAPSPSSFSRRSLCRTTTPPSRTRTSNTLRSTDSGPYWMVSGSLSSRCLLMKAAVICCDPSLLEEQEGNDDAMCSHY